MQTGRISTSKIPFMLLVTVRLEKNIRCMMKDARILKDVILEASLLKKHFPRAPLPLLIITLIPLKTLRNQSWQSYSEDDRKLY